MRKNLKQLAELVCKWLTYPARLREAEKRLDLQRKINTDLVADVHRHATREAELRIRISESEQGDLLPRLTRAEIERLALLADTAGHVASEAGWILRHGWAAPEDGMPNRVAMERVLGRMRSVINAMYEAGDVRGRELSAWQHKFRRIMAETTNYQG
jgi:hypothetical protein